MYLSGGDLKADIIQGFHTGEKAVCVKDIRRVLNAVVKGSKYKDPEEFLEKFKSFQAYSGIDEKHIYILWRALTEISGKYDTLYDFVNEINKDDFMIGLLGEQQQDVIKDVIDKEIVCDLATCLLLSTAHSPLRVLPS